MNKLLLLIPAFVLAGCTMTAQECDPSADPGFFNKIGCTVSGSYAERVETKEQDLKALKDENARLQKIHDELSNERALVRGSMEQRQLQLNSISNQLADLRSSLASKNQLSDNLKAKLDDLNSQLEAMKNTPAQASILEKRQELNRLKAEYEELMTLSGLY